MPWPKFMCFKLCVDISNFFFQTFYTVASTRGTSGAWFRRIRSTSTRLKTIAARIFHFSSWFFFRFIFRFFSGLLGSTSWSMKTGWTIIKSIIRVRRILLFQRFHFEKTMALQNTRSKNKRSWKENTAKKRKIYVQSWTVHFSSPGPLKSWILTSNRAAEDGLTRTSLGYFVLFIYPKM